MERLFETQMQLSQQLTRSCRNQYCATHGYLLDSSAPTCPKNSKDSGLDTEKDIDFKNDKAVIKKSFNRLIYDFCSESLQQHRMLPAIEFPANNNLFLSAVG